MKLRMPRPLTVIAVALVVFLYAPLIVTVIFAFNGAADLAWPPNGVSLRWFRAVFEDRVFRQAFVTSAEVSAATAVLASLIGSLSAFVFARSATRFSRALRPLALLPVALPPLVIGVALLTALTALGIKPSLNTVTVALVVYTVPYVIIIVSAGLRAFDPSLEEAARDLGARPRSVIRRVTIPILLPVVLGASLLAFAFAFDELLITTFVIGQQNTLPLVVASRARFSVDPSISAVATIMLVVPWLALAAAIGIGRRSVYAKYRAAEAGLRD